MNFPGGGPGGPKYLVPNSQSRSRVHIEARILRATEKQFLEEIGAGRDSHIEHTLLLKCVFLQFGNSIGTQASVSQKFLEILGRQKANEVRKI